MEYIVFTQNRSPTASKKRVPFHLFYKRRPNVKYLRKFGVKAFAHIGKSHKKKLDPITTPVVVLGYQEGVKGYKILDLKTGKVTQSDQVVFIENENVSLRDVNEIPAPADKPIVIISREIIPEQINEQQDNNRQNKNIQHEIQQNRELEPEIILQRRGPMQPLLPPNVARELNVQLRARQPLNEEHIWMIENQIEENRVARENINININEERRYPRQQNTCVNSRITEDEYDI